MGRGGYRKSRRAAERVLETLDSLDRRKAGAGARRSRDKFLRGPRYLTIKGNEKLFHKLCNGDFDYLMGQHFAAPPQIMENLLPQSLVGRAQNGHGWFVDEYGTPLAFPDATFDRVLTELEPTRPHMRADVVRQARADLLKQVQDFVLSHIDSEKMLLETADGPLLGIDFLAGRTVETRAFLRGMVLAGHMDDCNQRAMTNSWHRLAYDGKPYIIGGGDIRIVQRESFKRVGVEDPGRVIWEDAELVQMEELGVLQPHDPEALFSYPKFDQVYFRRRPGEGVCDDMALIHIGSNNGFDALLGAFVMDGIDTYDKYLSTFRSGGGDSALASSIQQHWLDRFDEPLVGGEEILDLIYFACKNNTPLAQLSSSHRRLIQVENGCTQPTVLHHWRFIECQLLDHFQLGFARMASQEFYGIAHKRLLQAGLRRPDPLFRHKRDQSG
jgi:hypothetical protein